MERLIPTETFELRSASTQYRVHAVRTGSGFNGGHTATFDTVYLDGRYRHGVLPSGSLPSVLPSLKSPLSKVYQRFVTLYDGNPDGIIWNYDIKLKDASPLPAGCFRYFEKLKRQQGEKALRTRFQIPSSISLDTLSIARGGSTRADNQRTEDGILKASATEGNFYVDLVIPSWGSLPPVMCPFPMDFRLLPDHAPARTVGTDVLLGRRCTVVRTPHGVGAKTLWIDTKTHFILRSDTSDPTMPSGRGNSKWWYTHFNTITSVPAEAFSLPPGTKIYLPELMRDYPLPKSMQRASAGGRLRILGFPLHPNT